MFIYHIVLLQQLNTSHAHCQSLGTGSPLSSWVDVSHPLVDSTRWADRHRISVCLKWFFLVLLPERHIYSWFALSLKMPPLHPCFVLCIVFETADASLIIVLQVTGFFFGLEALRIFSPSLKSASITSLYLRLNCCWSIFQSIRQALLMWRFSHSLI